MKHDHLMQLQQVDISFHHGLVSQFISPICQVMVEIIPTLIQQNTIQNKTMLCPSLTALCEKLSNELPKWTNIFVCNEDLKSRMINDFNVNNLNLHGGNSSTEAPVERTN
jgi:hypothetical protein